MIAIMIKVQVTPKVQVDERNENNKKENICKRISVENKKKSSGISQCRQKAINERKS